MFLRNVNVRSPNDNLNTTISMRQDMHSHALCAHPSPNYMRRASRLYVSAAANIPTKCLEKVLSSRGFSIDSTDISQYPRCQVPQEQSDHAISMGQNVNMHTPSPISKLYERHVEVLVSPISPTSHPNALENHCHPRFFYRLIIPQLLPSTHNLIQRDAPPCTIS